MNEIRVKAPATVANLGSGFDLLGLAIDQIADEVIVRKRHDSKLYITNIVGDGGKLPRKADENTCTVAIQSLLRKLNSSQGFDVEIKKHIAFNSGLGSSASSAVAGVFAVNELLGNPLTKAELIAPAMDGEFVASKGFHADNIAPCMLGGITFVQQINPVIYTNLPFHPDTHIVVLYQYVSVPTAEARAILPKSYSRETVIHQSSRLASLMVGLYNQDDKFLHQGLEDELATPYRSKLIPHFQALATIAKDNGCVGFNISGSGPSVFAWCKDKSQAESLKNSWKSFFQAKNEAHELYLSPINTVGVSVF